MFKITVTEEVSSEGTTNTIARERFVASSETIDLAALAALVFPSEDAPAKPRKVRSDKDVPRAKTEGASK